MTRRRRDDERDDLVARRAGQPKRSRDSTVPVPLNRSMLAPTAVLTLQRLAGNTAVARLLAPVQRRIQVDDWEYNPSLFDPKPSREEQFKSDAVLWFHTLFHRDPSVTGEEERRNRHQQYLLRRHFLAMAVLGVESGDQATGRYSPYADRTVPLAALASHGGRFAYESADGEVGRSFSNLLFGGNVATAPEVAKSFKKGGGTGSGAGAGLFERISTHGQKHVPGTGWQETHAKGAKGMGMNMAFGGVGHTIRDTKGKATVVGPEGWAAKGKKRAGYQLGTAFFREDADPAAGRRLMVGFEGTSPRADNQLGASHGVIASVLGAGLGLKKFKNERSLTGQAKAGGVGLPAGMGSMRARVTAEKLASLQAAVDALDAVRTHSSAGREYAARLFKDLLTSTTQAERDEAVAELKRAAALVRQRPADAAARFRSLATAGAPAAGTAAAVPVPA